MKTTMKAHRILFGLIVLLLAQTAYGAGVTIITHGNQIVSGQPTWVNAMSDAIVNRIGGNVAVFDMVLGMDLSTGKPAVQYFYPRSGNTPFSYDSEIVIRVFWDQVAGEDYDFGCNCFKIQAVTRDVAMVIEPYISQVVSGIGASIPFAQLPVHLIGHSRGGSVMSELARILGQKGIWVNQLTTLDPRFVQGDASVKVWETVLFADNYYEEYTLTVPVGVRVDSALNENLTDRLPGGYGDLLAANHSDVHLWYHGTIATGVGAYDGTVAFSGAMRNPPWYGSYEYGGQFAGFYYSRLGGGAYALDGFLDGYNDGGHNLLPAARVSLTRSASEWPSFITLINNASGSVQAGNAFPLHCIFQSYDSGASVTLFLDSDQNPYNGNEIALTLPAINPQPSTGLTTKVLDVNATVASSTPPGFYYVYGKINNPNGTRYLYAAGQVRVIAAGTSAAPTITSVSPSSLPSSASQQPIKIYGTRFTASSTLLFNGSIASDAARLTVVNANEIDYNIIVASAGNWNVKVINGAQQSNLGYFSVVNPPPNTGSLTLNLSPSGAVSAGAQWRVDGGSYRNTGDTATSLMPGSHAVSFKSLSSYTTPPDQTVNVVANQQATTNASYTPITSPGQTLSVSTTAIAVGSGIGSGGFLVQSGGSGTLNWSASASDTWLNILIPSGTISGLGGQNRLDFSFSQNSSGVPRTGTITITANGVSGSPQAVTITQAGSNTFYVIAISAQHGTVTKDPNFPAFPSGGVAGLTAVPDSGYQFNGWSGDITDSQNPIGVLMDGNKNITANFIRTFFVLTLNAQYGTVIKDPNQPGFTPGTGPTLTAVPNNGYEFSGWSGDITDNQNPITVLMNGDMNITANFTIGGKIPQTISFGALSRQVFGDAPFELSASASSGLPVSFLALSGPVILNGNIVTMTGAGLVVLRASQSGDATNAPAPNVDQVLIVTPGNNVITDAQRLANGMFTLRFYGESGTNYVVQGSTNLVNWLPLTTNQISGLGYLEFTDISSTNYAQKFYRIAP